jgi:2-oxoisovalerate dehydrogenase E2 component (dihydrolipoyl transacylase)
MQQSTAKGTGIPMPQFAESVVEATIGKWLKQPGDRVEQYEPLCEVVTDKVTAELPSTVEGVLLEIVAQEGDTIDVGAIVCVIDEGGQAVAGAEAVNASAAPVIAQSTAASSAAGHTGADSADRGMSHRYSPAVRRLADDHELDLRQVSGSGMGGRITRKDVLDYLERGPQRSASTPAASVSASADAEAPAAPVQRIQVSEPPKMPRIEIEPSTTGGREYFIDVTPIRKTIANRMHQSSTEIPHAWTSIEVDVTNLALLRNKVKDEFKRNEGVNLTYMAFLIKSVVSAIKDYPIMNSVWNLDKITVKRDINISLAVGTEDSVMTPVIHNADQKNIIGIAKEVEDLAARTRAGKLRPGDMTGGTFTINNTGTFGSVLSYPIINYPQAAILTFESIVKRPVVINDMIAVRSMVNLCMSFDHRILDGIICGRFHQRVKDNLESYGPDTKLY